MYVYGLILPLLLIAIIIVADILEGPKTAYVGVLACVAPIAAAFGSLRMVIGVSLIAWLSASAIGIFASDGNVMAAQTRLIIIFLVSLIAIGITRVRIKSQIQFNELTSRLAVAEVIAEHSNLDYLTGELNRYGVIAKIAEMQSELRSVVIIDLDDFKLINDEYGHQVGDEVIKAVSGRISSALKHDDVFGRWGGDEFIAVLPTDEKQAHAIIDRVLESATQTEIHIADSSIPVMFSAGVAQWSPGQEFEEVLGRADQSLYHGKKLGGRTVKSASSLNS